MNRYTLQRRALELWIVFLIVCTGGFGQDPTSSAIFREISEVQDGFSVAVIDLMPGIQVKKAANVSSGVPGSAVKFVIEVTNSGGIELDHVLLQDQLPEGLVYLDNNRSGDVQEQKITWNLGPLIAGQSKSVELTAQINGTPSSLTNHAIATGTLSTGQKLADEDQVEVRVLREVRVLSNEVLSNEIVLIRNGTFWIPPPREKPGVPDAPPSLLAGLVPMPWLREGYLESDVDLFLIDLRQTDFLAQRPMI